MAGTAASLAWADRFSSVRSRGFRWSSTTTAWAKTRWVLATVSLGRSRIHTDDSVEIKYYDQPEKLLDKMAFSLTGDLGCEYGGGVSCSGIQSDSTGAILSSQADLLGWMAYNRWWFKKDLYATYGRRRRDEQSRALSDSAAAHQWSRCHHRTPYFTGNPGDPFKAWDTFGYV